MPFAWHGDCLHVYTNYRIRTLAIVDGVAYVVELKEGENVLCGSFICVSDGFEYVCVRRTDKGDGELRKKN